MLKLSNLYTIIIIIFTLSPIISLQSTASPAMSYTIPLTIIALILSIASQKYIFRKESYFAIAFFISCLLSCLVNNMLDIKIIKCLNFVVFYICVIGCNYSRENIKTIGQVYVTMSIILSLLIILSYLNGNTYLDLDGEVGGRYSIDIIGVSKNPNYLVAFINIGLFLLVYNSITKGFKIVNIILVIIIIYAVYLTGTRAGILTTLFILFTCTTLLLRNRKRISKTFIIILLMVFVAFSLDSIIELYSNFTSERELFEDIGRTESWMIAIDRILSRPLMGYGIDSWHRITPTNNVLEYLHNVYLELIFNQGVLGLTIFLFLFFYGYRNTNKTDRFFIIILIIILIFPLFFQNGLIDVNFWRPIIISRIAILYSSCSKDGLKALFT